jgi:NAD-dependent dihydropyrimidine dehydrogenase PreA subunit
VVLHPEECWYCGPCVDDCPLPGAIRLNHPLQQRVRWKRKGGGGHFRV